MDIENLKSKRQLNVQEQNALTECAILSEALYWRKNKLPMGLMKVIENREIDIRKSIILNYEQNFPGCSTDEGIIVTNDGRFIKFEMDLSDENDNLVELYLWDSISVEINASKKGTGATWGYLALKVLRKLNSEMGE